MIEALGLEVAAIRKKGRDMQIELRGGQRAGQTERPWLYHFIITEDFNLRDDTPIRVIAGQEDVEGVVVSFRDGVLTVALEKDLGPQIAAARLVADDAFLLERLQEKLRAITSGGVQFNCSAAERVLGAVEPRVADAEPHPSVIHDLADARQLSAIRLSLGSDTAFIWGPPGTGKTTTLGRIVEAHYRMGRSVLLVSNTNIAVDTALERVAERLKGEPDFYQGLVLRHGPVVKEELRERFGLQVIVEDVVTRLGGSLRQEKEKLTREAALLQDQERSLATSLQQREQLVQTQAALTSLERKRDETTSAIASREREAEQKGAAAAQLRTDLERALAMSAFRRFLSRLNPEKLGREAAQAERAAHVAAEAARAMATDLLKIEAEIDSIRREIERLTRETHALPTESALQGCLNKLRTRLSQVRQQIEILDRELAALEQQVLANCRILATTVYRTYLTKFPTRQFDVVIVDEASMLMPPLVYYAAGLSMHSVTVTGDFRQLPPIVLSDERLAREWLKKDVFEIAGIPQQLGQEQPPSHLVALEVQYRMREPICEVLNELFYADYPLVSDRRACSGPDVRRAVKKLPFGAAPLLYVDTAPFHPWTAQRLGGYSRYNLFHALLVRGLVAKFIEAAPAAGTGDAVGAIAPYAAQARLVQALLEDRLGSPAVGVAATVHRFQGNQKQVVVLDLTDSLGLRIGRFLSAVRLEEDGARLLNVAVSRAKYQLVLVANFEYLRSKAPYSGFVQRLLDHFEEHAEALSPDKVLAISEREWLDGIHCIFPEDFDFPEHAAGAFTEGSFYPVFKKDLMGAQRSIVIFSPFLTSNGTGRWVDCLRLALMRGVQVRILTCPPAESGEASELIEGLRSLGVVVDLRARMHEKIAVIDGRTLWHGSLNILSHRDTHESMLRIESPAVCQQLGRFIGSPAQFQENAPDLVAAENPECPVCGGATIWNSGRYGVWYTCEDPGCDGKVDARQRSGQRRAGGARHRASGQRRGQRRRNTDSGSRRACPNPGCGGRLVQRNGRFGWFLGCTRYPACRYSEDLN